MKNSGPKPLSCIVTNVYLCFSSAYSSSAPTHLVQWAVCIGKIQKCKVVGLAQEIVKMLQRQKENRKHTMSRKQKSTGQYDLYVVWISVAFQQSSFDLIEIVLLPN